MLEIMKASAGSGKTYRLARKYITLLLQSSDTNAYRHILAVTFTNKATDEMKGRILKELYQLSVDSQKSDYYDFFVPSMFRSGKELSEKSGKVLSELLHDYSAFAVSTIDRFFQQTLKAFSKEIGQFASYQVELDKDSLVAESVDRILDSLTEDDSGLLSWLTDNVLEQIEQGGRYSMDANLLELAKRLMSVQRQEAIESAGMLQQKEYSKEKLLSVRNECRRIESTFIENVRSMSDAVLRIMEDAGVNPSDSNRGFLKALYHYSQLKDSDPVEAPSASFMSKALDHEQWFAKSKASRLKPLVYPFMEAPLEDFCNLFDVDFKVYNTAVIVDRQLYGLGVASELDRNFKEIMKEKNVLCIDDSNTILRDIIDGSDAPFVYEKLGVRFDHFLLDEFQDTSLVQWSNFSPLLRESDSKGGENLIVGDVKQSIYRWRGSDWKLLDEKVPDAFPKHKEEILDSNYRSLADVVNFNNLFFYSAAGIMDSMNGHKKGDGPLAEIYSDVFQEVAKNSSDKGSVTLTFCDKEAELQKVLEAVMQARQKGAMLSEIAVLVRSNAIGEDVAMYLIDNDIPVVTDDSLRIKSSITVRRLVSLMSFMENPQDEVNGFLAHSLNIDMPRLCGSLTDMAEALFRELKKTDTDKLWKGESLHIQSFLDYVKDYSSVNGNSLRGFLKYWEEENPSISSPSSGESVRVMTIHKSKGLDFPYVIIPFAENITLYKPGKYWCAPELKDTPLEGVAEGVYDVVLSKSSQDTLFADDYQKENFLQQVDNINTLYVAMTRAALGMHIIAKRPAEKYLDAIKKSESISFTDFSQILYWFAYKSAHGDIPGNEELIPPFKISYAVNEEGDERFETGEIVEFGDYRKKDEGASSMFIISASDELPSIPLNSESVDSEEDVKVRGRLKFSADSLDFFSNDGDAGISASNRIRGVVLHDILSKVTVPSDLDKAICSAVNDGSLTSAEAEEVGALLAGRLSGDKVQEWFPSDPECVMNETELIDERGEVYRPDRVVVKEGKVMIIDYKFGTHRREYVDQLKNYAAIWRRMGYDDVVAYLWYVQNDEIISV